MSRHLTVNVTVVDLVENHLRKFIVSFRQFVNAMKHGVKLTLICAVKCEAVTF